MGDVVSSINGVKITDVEMATQVIKLTAGIVEVRAANELFSRPDHPGLPEIHHSQNHTTDPPHQRNRVATSGRCRNRRRCRWGSRSNNGQSFALA